MVSCRPGTVLNPETGRCVKASGRIGRRILEGFHFVSRNSGDEDAAIERANDYSREGTFLEYLIEEYSDCCVPLDIKGYSKTSSLLWWCTSRGRRLLTPQGFHERLDECIEGGARFIIVPLALENHAGCDVKHEDAHANVLLYDTFERSLELFEPNGVATKNYDYHLLVYEINELFDGYVNTFHEPMQYCPIGFQRLESKVKDEEVDLGGYCAVWSLWYVEQRLSNPHLTRDEVVQMSFAYFDTPEKMRKHVRDYARFINEVYVVKGMAFRKIE